MNNWGIVFVVIGVLTALSIVSGYLLTNKAIDKSSELLANVELENTEI